ncbi:MAG TPA: glycosyltransferase [Thermoleophilia bacterium]|nr:glycosyltransferase [Thermoleophilia bacterium]
MGAREHSFPGHRTEQFAEALLAAGCEVTAVVLAEGSRHHGRKAPRLRLHSLPAERFRAGVELQAIHDAAAPDVVVAAGGYHAARVVSGLTTSVPRWIDLPGDLAAEGQLRAHAEGDARLRDPLSVLARALTAGDQFSVVGASQRLALLGQLGLCGRLTGATLGQEPVAIVPLACDGPVQAVPLAAGPLRLLWYGGYNTWMDAETLLAGLESALGSDPAIRFESTGGAIRDHDELSYGRFWERARASPVAARLLDHGRIPRRRATALLDECHVVLCLSRACLESELGSRFRLIEALAHGRPVVATRGGDLARDVELAEAGILVPPGEPRALARAVLALASDRPRLEACARNARSLWQARFTYAAATEPLRAWLAAPRCWPRSILGEVVAADSERQRLQSELDAIRGSRTFRALRIFDRLTRRGGEGR